MKPIPRSVFISHGGGPLPLLGDPGHREMVSCLQGIAAGFPAPDAIVVVSAHWEEPVPAITAVQQPALVYDYYGFPPESYEIQYPCAGHPALAGAIQRLLAAAGIEARLDATRGLDHGVFVPLKIMYPQADIPCVQLSLAGSLDPALHIRMGRALGGLSRQHVLLLGSGFSFHNLKAFFAPESAASRELNRAFEGWLKETCGDRGLTEQARSERLVHWEQARGARYCHPREEHLLPLHVCYGAGQGPCVERFAIGIMGKQSSLYVW